MAQVRVSATKAPIKNQTHDDDGGRSSSTSPSSSSGSRTTR